MLQELNNVLAKLEALENKLTTEMEREKIANMLREDYEKHEARREANRRRLASITPEERRAKEREEAKQREYYRKIVADHKEKEKRIRESPKDSGAQGEISALRAGADETAALKQAGQAVEASILDLSGDFQAAVAVRDKVRGESGGSIRLGRSQRVESPAKEILLEGTYRRIAVLK